MAKRPHTAFLLSRPYGPDVRAEKQAHTLAAAGWRVSIVAWDRECRYRPHAHAAAPELLASALAEWPETVASPGQVTVTHIPIRAGYLTGRRLLRTLPRFWWRVWQELRRLKPGVIHANDLDTLPVAVLYGRAVGVPVLFDVRDYYPGMVRASVGVALSAALEGLERALLPLADGTLAVSEAAARRYRDLGARAWVVENAQPLPDRAALDAQGRAFRRRLGVPDGALLVVYVGYLNPERVLKPLLEAVLELDNVWLAVGGTGPQLPAVQAAATACARIRVLGWVPLHDVFTVVAAGDVAYYGFDARNPNSAYFMPNLAYFALAAGRPILTTPVGAIAELVRRESCGVVLDAPERDAVRVALRQLCDTAYRDTLSKYARTIGQRYHWLDAAEQLLAAYRALVPDAN